MNYLAEAPVLLFSGCVNPSVWNFCSLLTCLAFLRQSNMMMKKNSLPCTSRNAVRIKKVMTHDWANCGGLLSPEASGLVVVARLCLDEYVQVMSVCVW